MNVDYALLDLYGLIGLHFVVIKRVWIAGGDRKLVRIFRVAIREFI
jgi:hypothetical protein